MTINDLKPGYLVQLKNGEMYMVAFESNRLVLVNEPCNGKSQWLSLCYFNADMTHGGDFTIMKVFGYSKYAHKAISFEHKYRDLLWERKPEKKQYTYAQLREILGEEFEVIG